LKALFLFGFRLWYNIEHKSKEKFGVIAVKRFWQKRFINLAILLIFVLTFSLVCVYLKLQNGKVIETVVEIPQNTSTKDVAMILKKNGIIKNPYFFMFYVKLNNYKIAAGKYKLSSDMTYKQLCDTLKKGFVPRAAVRFTIPEGFTAQQIAKKLQSLGLVDENKFLETINNYEFNFKYKYSSKEVKFKLEGFLFPDTYEVYPGTSEKDIVKMMLNRFLEVYENLKDKKTTDLDDVQTVILASIIEKEAKKDSERGLIAGVFLNRLQRGIKLESCATVEYVLPVHKEVLSLQDVRIESPYNTYLKKGLPPSAICSPGKKSLLAALNPAKTDYLFFVAKKDGSHIFSKTFEDHLKAQKQIEEGKK